MLVSFIIDNIIFLITALIELIDDTIEWDFSNYFGCLLLSFTGAYLPFYIVYLASKALTYIYPKIKEKSLTLINRLNQKIKIKTYKVYL